MNNCSNTHASAALSMSQIYQIFYTMIFLKSSFLFLCGIAFDYFLKNGLFIVLVVVILMSDVVKISLGLIKLYCKILPLLVIYC